jgi:hypothetical protein
MSARYGDKGYALSELAETYGLPADVEADLQKMEDRLLDLTGPRVVRLGPLDVRWWSSRQWWFRLFGYGLAVKPKDEWRQLTCRNRMGWHRYHVTVGSLRVCPLRRIGA